MFVYIMCFFISINYIHLNKSFFILSQWFSTDSSCSNDWGVSLALSRLGPGLLDHEIHRIVPHNEESSSPKYQRLLWKNTTMLKIISPQQSMGNVYLKLHHLHFYFSKEYWSRILKRVWTLNMWSFTHTGLTIVSEA